MNILDRFLNELFGEESSNHNSNHKRFVDAVLKNRKNTYNRILSNQEKEALSPEAFGYLLSLASLKSITRYQFEYMLLLSINMFNITFRQLDLKQIQKMVDIVVLEANGNVNPNKLAAMLFTDAVNVKTENTVH